MAVTVVMAVVVMVVMVAVVVPAAVMARFTIAAVMPGLRRG